MIPVKNPRTVLRILIPAMLLIAEAAGLCFLLSSPAPECISLDEPNQAAFRPFGALCAAGLLTGVILCILLNLKKTSVSKILLLFSVIVPVSFLCSRLLFCMNYIGKFKDSDSVRGMLYVQNGGWMMWGVTAGIMLTCAVFAGIDCNKDIRGRKTGTADLLNMLALPILVFIVFERFGEYYTDYGRGLEMKPGSSEMLFFPLFTPRMKGTRVFRWKFSVWFIEGLFALILFAVLLILRKKVKHPFVSMIALYSAGQIVFESMLACDCPKWGAFVRVNMVLCGAALLALTVIPLLRDRQWSQFPVRILNCLALLAICGIGEWAKDKTGVPNTIIYGIMFLYSGLCAANVLTLWHGKRDVFRRNTAA